MKFRLKKDKIGFKIVDGALPPIGQNKSYLILIEVMRRQGVKD